MGKTISNNNNIFLVNFIPSINRQNINFRQPILHKNIEKYRIGLINRGKFIGESTIVLKFYQWSKVKVSDFSRVKN